MYEKATEPSTDRLRAGELYALSLYQAARQLDDAFSDRNTRAGERSGFRDRALAHYRSFVSIWGDADPIFSDKVAEARARLARLKAGQSGPSRKQP